MGLSHAATGRDLAVMLRSETGEVRPSTRLGAFTVWPGVRATMRDPALCMGRVPVAFAPIHHPR